MKFPLVERPFRRLELSQHQCDQYERTAQSVLRETVAEYDHFVTKQNRMMNKKRWKAVKTRENVTVFKKRDREDAVNTSTTASMVAASHLSSTLSLSSHSSGSSEGGCSSVHEWSLPKLLAVGTIVGNFDDVMYGFVAPDDDSTKIKSSYVDDEVVDGQVLYPIHHGTMEDPYRFLGLKWFVKAHPASVNAVVKPRDFVFLESSGTHYQANGSAIAYRIMHSVNLPECPELSRLGIIRASLSSCFLFIPRLNNTVEVYMKSFVEPAGTVPDAVAVMSAANGLIGCWKSVWCAQNKKLSWMMRDVHAADLTWVSPGRRREGSKMVVTKTNAHGKNCCSLCDVAFSTFRSGVVCELCRTTVCTRCKTTRKLTYVHGGYDVRKVPTTFCKNCITLANSTNSMEFARLEYVPGALEARWKNSAATPDAHSAAVAQPQHKRVDSHHQSQAAQKSKPIESTPSEWRREDSNVSTVSSSVPLNWSIGNSLGEDRIELSSSIEVDTIDHWEMEQNRMLEHEDNDHISDHCHRKMAEPRTPVTGVPPLPNPQAQLYIQMSQLRLQAEQAYETARQNYRAMHEAAAARHQFS